MQGWCFLTWQTHRKPANSTEGKWGEQWGPCAIFTPLMRTLRPQESSCPRPRAISSWYRARKDPKPGQCLDICRYQWSRSATRSKWGITNIHYNKRRNPDHQPSLTSLQVKCTATHLQRARSGFGWHPTWYWLSGFSLCSREHVAPCQANVIAPWTDPVILSLSSFPSHPAPHLGRRNWGSVLFFTLQVFAC